MSITSRLLAATGLLGFFAPAAAEVMIAPTRVIITPSAKSAELVLVNKGDERAAFRIGIENRRMDLDGSMEDANEAKPDELFAADKVRVSPRQLMLEPGERQTIRVSASDTANLAPGEYRAHLRLMSAPVSEAKTRSASPSDGNSLSIQLVAIRSLTIPVLVRIGALGAASSVKQAGFAKPDRSLLAVRLTRTGTRSTYGDVKLTVEGERDPAYHVRGVAVYVPNAERDVLVPLPDEVRGKLAGRRVRVDYVSTDPADAGKVASLTVQL